MERFGVPAKRVNREKEKGAADTAPFLYAFGENVNRTETKITPTMITSSGHHRSNQDADSLDELISTVLLFFLHNPNREPKPLSICSRFCRRF